MAFNDEGVAKISAQDIVNDIMLHDDDSEDLTDVSSDSDSSDS